MTKYTIQVKKTCEYISTYDVPVEYKGKTLSMSDALNLIKSLNGEERCSQFDCDFDLKTISTDISFIGVKNTNDITELGGDTSGNV